jgi:hypothetical protein
MKKTLLISLFLSFTLLISACSGPAADDSSSEEENTTSNSSTSNTGLKRYAVESGSVTYELSGSLSGTKTVSWKDWGMTERTENDNSITTAGMDIPNNDIILMLGNFMYTFKPDAKNGSKIKNGLLEQISSINNKDLEEIGMDLMKAMGGKKTGTESIAGKTCDVYEISNVGSETCIWKGINLKNDVAIAGVSVTEIASSVSTDTQDDSLFELPADVTFKDLGDISDIMKNL